MISVTDHHRNLRASRCVISNQPNPTLHHVHGGSIRAHGIMRGKSQKVSDWLVIPIAAEYHVGDYGIDAGMSVPAWERLFGTQLFWLTEVCRIHMIDVFHNAGFAHPGMVPRWVD